MTDPSFSTEPLVTAANPAAQLGRLQRVSELRSVWLSESAHFTPWLAQEDNILLLGEAIGIELEVEAQEKQVGPFRADILCKDAINGHWVLVENQLERTDHTHLGQLMTYAAGLSAVTIVWIAQRFTEEHRAALDWLNEITNEDVNFFGLEVELWRIGESPIAPKFNIISKPNDWTRRLAGAARSLEAGELTETKQLQLEYWSVLDELIERGDTALRPHAPRPGHVFRFSLGRTGFQLRAFANTRDQRIGVQLILDNKDAKPHFHLLLQDKDRIEAEVGSPLDWRELPDNKRSGISLRWHECDPEQREQWPEQHEWLLAKLEAFHRVFSPRVRRLDASLWELEEDEVDTI